MGPDLPWRPRVGTGRPGRARPGDVEHAAQEPPQTTPAPRGGLGDELRIVDATQEPAIVERFLDLEAAGWKGDRSRGGEARRVVPGAVAWFTQVVEVYRERGEAYVLRVGPPGAPVYLAVRVRRDGVVFSVSDAYDPDWSAYSPGAWGRLLETRYLAAWRRPSWSTAAPTRAGTPRRRCSTPTGSTWSR
ncbi:GNAT family N-acetyltransferase [Oerskovia sp. M15]